MHLLALLGIGFSGVVTSALGAVPIAGGTGVSECESVASKFGTSLVPQVSSGPIFFIPIHKPSHFSFSTTLKDDGQGKGGGWQEAKANLPFAQTTFPIGVRTWYCDITIGMPIRNSQMGYISPTTAATMSAAVTNKAASNTDFNLPQGVFCIKFRKEVEVTFPAMYPDLGARVRL
jgi:hypothetical protein